MIFSFRPKDFFSAFIIFLVIMIWNIYPYLQSIFNIYHYLFSSSWLYVFAFITSIEGSIFQLLKYWKIERKCNKYSITFCFIHSWVFLVNLKFEFLKKFFFQKLFKVSLLILSLTEKIVCDVRFKYRNYWKNSNFNFTKSTVSHYSYFQYSITCPYFEISSPKCFKMGRKNCFHVRYV